MTSRDKPPMNVDGIPLGLMLALSLTSFTVAAAIRMVEPMLPRFAEVFSVSLTEASWTVTGALVAYGLLQMVFGPLGDRYGKLRVIAISSLAAAVASTVCATANSLVMLIAGRALVGVSCACVVPLTMAWIGDTVAAELRQHALARYLVGQILGVALGLSAGGRAADQTYWQWPFWVCAGLFLTSSLWLWTCAGTHDRARPQAPGKLHQELAAVLSIRWARVVLLTALLEGITVMGAMAFLATHLHLSGGLSLSVAGTILIALAAGGMLYALTSRYYAQWLKERGLALVGAGLIAVAYCSIALYPRPLPATAAAVLLGLGFYMLHNLLQFKATQMAPERRGAAMTLFATAFFIGQSIGTALVAACIARYGSKGVLFAAGVSILPIVLGFVQQLERRDLSRKSGLA